MDMITTLKVRVNQIEKELKENNVNKDVSSAESQAQSKLQRYSENGVVHQITYIPKDKQNFSLKTFSEVIKGKLANVPINRVGITKNGEGYIKLPSKNVCEAALKNLNCLENIKAATFDKRSMLPKITVLDLDKDLYSNDNKDQLKTAILNKNSSIKECVDDGRDFDIVFIAPDKKNNFAKAVIRIHPDILKTIQKCI